MPRPHRSHEAASPSELEQLSTAELLREIAATVTALARAELELSRAELKSDIRNELSALRTLAIAAIGALIGLTLVFVAAALALAQLMPAWGAALLVAAAVLGVAAGIGALGWSHRVRRPLRRTRRSLEASLDWTKEQRRS
jgi:uncharacterized membrane protein YqjE